MLNPIVSQGYLVTLYNKDVRALVKDNLCHPFYEDHWADARVLDVEASSEDEARVKIEARYPFEDGFVIESIVLVPR